MSDDVNAKEVLAIAARVLEAVHEQVSCSPELLVAALKIAASSIEAGRDAQFQAQIRANMMQQYRPK